MRRLTSENKERKYKMAKILISPSKYLQGAGEMKNLGTYAAKSGKKALVLISKGGYKRIGKTIEESFAESTCEVVFDYFNGECCNSEIDRLVKIVKDEQCDLTIGIGGGKIFDTAKAVAYYAGTPVFICPTIASTDAPCSALSVIYTEEGVFEKYLFLPANPNLVLMEMNTRIQVEHPVTEWVTGIDLVKEQLKIASGMPLEIAQEDVRIQGHAIECRINAENPQKNFRPSPGTIQGAHFPGGNGIRVDTCVYNGCKIPPYYDSMLAKLIVHAGNRKEAIAKMQSALGEVIIDGIDTNIDYQYEILKDEDYQSGNFDTGFLASHIIAGVKINEN